MFSPRRQRGSSMIDIFDDQRRRAFSIWLRTGRLPSGRSADAVEFKFNPWHDPETGRFTFVGTGQQYGQWGGSGFPGGGKSGGGAATGSWDRPARPPQPKSQDPASRAEPRNAARSVSPRTRPAPSQPPARGTRAGGPLTEGGGGSFGGAGASGTWGAPKPGRRPDSSPGSTTASGSSNRFSAANRASQQPASTQTEKFRTVLRNGYTYQIDVGDRTRRVSGMLTTTKAPSRSRTSQRQAGGAERRTSDDGGHYIAARFNGPSEAFNHFAQDANFNRGGYRLLEDEWARDKRAGRAVTVKIVPQFNGGSVRPSTINVWWTVDGKLKSSQFPNERSEKRRGRN